MNGVDDVTECSNEVTLTHFKNASFLSNRSAMYLMQFRHSAFLFFQNLRFENLTISLKLLLLPTQTYFIGEDKTTVMQANDAIPSNALNRSFALAQSLMKNWH